MYQSPENTWYPSRRRMLATGAGVLSAGVLSSCATGGDEPDGTAAKGEANAQNPLGAPADAPLEVVIFKGGYGDEYAKHAEAMYNQRFPNSKVDHKGIQRVGEV